MIDKADTYCGKCIKADVCGMEGVYDPARTYCAYRVIDRPHGEWQVNSRYNRRGCKKCGLLRDGALPCDIKDKIKEAPTIDRPHGKWVVHDRPLLQYGCNICGNLTNINSNFCPNCGAPMTEEAFRKYNGLKEGDNLARWIKRENSEKECEAKIKELKNAIANCKRAEEEFKKRTCKFRSPTNCDFCSFHSDCDEHWKDGDEDASTS